MVGFGARSTTLGAKAAGWVDEYGGVGPTSRIVCTTSVGHRNCHAK